MTPVDRTAFDLAVSVAAVKEQLLDKQMHGTNRRGERIAPVTVDDLRRIIDYFDTFDVTVSLTPARTGNA